MTTTPMLTTDPSRPREGLDLKDDTANNSAATASPSPSPPARPKPIQGRRFDDPALFQGSPKLQQESKRLEPHFADLATRQLFTLLGVADLVPMPGGHAMPLAEAAALPPAAYFAELARHPLGVMCGPGSENLCALMAANKPCAAFLRDNPALLNSLIVHPSGDLILLFLRFKDMPPPVCLPAEGKWFGSGQVVPVFERAPGSFFLCLNPVPPAVVACSDINWDALPNLHLELRLGVLARQHGPEVLATPGGRPRVNENFWAGFCVSVLGIRYDTQAGEFIQVSTAGQPRVPVTGEVVMADLTRVLLLRSQSPGREILALHREHRHLKRILDLVKVLGAEKSCDDRDNLVAFLQEAVESCPGASVTAEELFRAYRVFCAAAQIAAISERRFHPLVTEWLQQRFQVDKSHSILREGTARRGFRDLGLRQTGTSAGTP